MSRIGRKPIPIPKGVTTQLDGTRITVKGPKGEISRLVHAELAVAVEGETIVVRRPSDESRHKALHGLTRTLVANMVDGVTKGFAKALEIQGVGYKAEPKPFGVQLVVGFSKHIYAQIVDDARGVTLVGAADTSEGLQVDGKGKTAKSFGLGRLLAAKAKEKGISKVVFDRGGYQYHGRVKAVADGARKGGLEL